MPGGRMKNMSAEERSEVAKRMSWKSHHCEKENPEESEGLDENKDSPDKILERLSRGDKSVYGGKVSSKTMFEAAKYLDKEGKSRRPFESYTDSQLVQFILVTVSSFEGEARSEVLEQGESAEAPQEVST